MWVPLLQEAVATLERRATQLDLKAEPQPYKVRGQGCRPSSPRSRAPGGCCGRTRLAALHSDCTRWEALGHAIPSTCPPLYRSSTRCPCCFAGSCAPPQTLSHVPCRRLQVLADFHICRSNYQAAAGAMLAYARRQVAEHPEEPAQLAEAERALATAVSCLR